MRRLVEVERKVGRIIFNLVDGDEILCVIYATPLDVSKVVNPRDICLTPDEKVFCQLAAKHTLDHLL